VTILFYVVVVPLRLAFHDTVPGSSFLKAEGVWLTIDITADLMFLFDICLNFRTAVKIDGVLVKSGKDIACHYVSNWFFPDLLASFPTSFVTNSAEEIPGEVRFNKLVGILSPIFLLL
jgi:hypothetical protein